MAGRVPSAKAGFRISWNGGQLTEDMLRAAASAVDATLDEAVALAKGFAPVRTGRLRDSIARGRARITRTTVSGAFGAYGTPYGLFVELGTSKMPAHPYLRPAADRAFPKLAEYLAAISGGDAGFEGGTGAGGGPGIGGLLAVGGVAAAGVGAVAGIGAIGNALGGR